MAQVLLENVTKNYGKLEVVHGINLDIAHNEFVVLVGPSGCGKSTTLRMIAGLEDISAGDISIGGQVVNDMPPRDRNISMVFQNYALYPHMTVRENLGFSLQIAGKDQADITQAVNEAAGILSLGDYLDRKPSELSGGQRQRVALARALVTEPPVLLLDEPLSALDANLVVRMQSVLTRLQKELGITFVYVTHSQSEAFAMADRVVIMSAGVIEQIGSPREIYRSPASRFVAEFVGTNNIISGNIKEIKGNTMIFNTAFGTIESKQEDRNTRHQEGNDVELVISADMIELSQEHTFSENEIQLQFVAEEFTGSVVTLYFEDANKNELIVQKQQREIEPLELTYGCQIFAHWDPINVFCLPDAKTE